MAPQAVIDQMAGDIAFPYQYNTAAKENYASLDVAMFQVNHYREIWGPYLSDSQMERVFADPPPVYGVVITRVVTLRDIRAFSSDGKTAYASVGFSQGYAAIFSPTINTLQPPITVTMQYSRARTSPIIEIWQVVFDVRSGRWLIDRFVDRIVE